MPVPTDAMPPNLLMVEPRFVNYFCHLASGKIGTVEGKVKQTLSLYGGHAHTNQGTDRFQLDIPFAGQTLHWHVQFDGEQPECPPQFSFAEEPDFLQDMSLDELDELLPALANWDDSDADALLDVVNQLIAAYRAHQLQKFSVLDGDSGSNRNFKVRQLLSSESLSDSDLEVFVGITDVVVLVRLAIDLSRVPQMLLPPPDAAGHEEVLASLLLRVSDNKQSSQLLLSPRMQLIVGSDCKVPTVQESMRLSLPEYVQRVKKLLDDRIQSIVGGSDARKNFLAALVTLMGRALIEYDTENFLKASFLLEWNNFFFMVHCCLPNEFPEARPNYIFQSIYHAPKQRPYSSQCSDYPYESKWSPAEMADRAKNFILEYVAKFQADSIRA